MTEKTPGELFIKTVGPKDNTAEKKPIVKIENGKKDEDNLFKEFQITPPIHEKKVTAR